MANFFGGWVVGIDKSVHLGHHINNAVGKQKHLLLGL